MMRPPVKLTKRSPIASERPQPARTHRDALDELLDFDIDISNSPNRRSKSKKGASDGFRALIVGNGNSNQPRKLGSFEESLDEYVELIRIEGRKALSLAKCQLNAALALNADDELGELKMRLAERDELIATLSRDIESRKESSIRQSRQLHAFAGLIARQGPRSILSKSLTHEEIVKSVLSQWMLNAKDRKRDREGSFVYTIMYESKLSLKVWNAWRLSAVTESMAQITNDRLSVLEAEKDAIIAALTNQRNEMVTALEAAHRDLQEERVKRSEVLLKVKSLFAHKFEDISSEVDNIGDTTRNSPKAIPSIPQLPPSHPVKKQVRH